MKKIFFLWMMSFLILACGPSVPVPAWKDNASRYLETYKTNFLAGKELATEPHFYKARKEIAAGNDMDLLSSVYLTKYSLHAASLEYFDTSDFAKIYRQEPHPAHMSYCHFLKGNFNAVDLGLLDKNYQGVLKAAIAKDMTAASREISLIVDPLSRLVACGVWVRYLPYDDKILKMAIDTASANGWKRPLWAYLEKLHDYYLGKNEQQKAGLIHERLEILKK